MAWILIIVGIVILIVCVMLAYSGRRRGPASSSDKVGAVVSGFDIWDWPIFSWFKVKQIQSVTRQAEARSDLAQAVNSLESSTNLISRADAEHQNYLLDAQLRAKLTSLAMEEGLNVSTLMAVIQKERFNELDIKRAGEEARIQIEAALIYQLRDYHEVSMIGRRLDGLFEEIDSINRSNRSAWLKEQMVAARMEDVQFLQEDRHVKRQRLLQANNRTDAQGSNTGSDDSGDAGLSVETIEQPLPDKKPRGRPRGSSTK